MPTPHAYGSLHRTGAVTPPFARPVRRASVTSARARRSIDLGALGLALIVMTYVLYLPLGPALIYNELVSGPSHVSELLAKVWSVGRYFAALVVAPLLLLTRSGVRSLVRCWPAAPFAVFAAASIAWSAFPMESLRQILNLFAVTVVAATLVSWYGLAGFGRRAQIATGAVMIASVLAALLVPRLGVHHGYDLVATVHAGRWRGVFLHKNLLGGISVTAIIYGLRSIRQETLPWKLYFTSARICAVACCVMAGSASAWVGAATALIFFLLMKNRLTSNPLVLGAALVVGAVVIRLLPVDAGQIAEALGRDSTFSGRTEIWALGRSMIQSHLLFGSGLAADGAVFGQLAKQELFSAAVDLHSGYLDVLFNLGVIGAALMLFAIGAAMVRGYVHAQRRSGAERDQAVVFMTLVVAAAAVALAETSPIAMMGDGAIGLWTALPALYQLGAAARRRRAAGARRGSPSVRRPGPCAHVRTA